MADKTVAKATGAVRDLKSLALSPRSPKGAAPEAFVPGLGNVDIGIQDVGSWSAPGVQFTSTGWGFGTPTPFLILVHPRQNQFTDNQNNGFPDQFATQVINTDSDSITILITRIDPNSEDQGWGQDLELDIFVVE
jgi:hypothetical protein